MSSLANHVTDRSPAYLQDLALAERIERRFGIAVSPADARTLRRAELTLHHWFEEECNGTIQRDGDDGDGKPRRYLDMGSAPAAIWPIRDREAGARKRIAEVCARNGLHFYVQTDPRGCALYVSNKPFTDFDYSSHGLPCCL